MYKGWLRERAELHGWRGNNLNTMRVDDESPNGAKLLDPAANSGAVTVVFRNLIPHVKNFISLADAVVGCCAWLTHPEVLRALSQKQQVSIVVNKEDFLRPDANGPTDRELRRHYQRLGHFSRQEHEPTRGLSYCTWNDDEAVRCVGVCDGHSLAARPRLHHKFLVALHRDLRRGDEEPCYQATAVWTGSLNLTRGGERSLENAVVIEDPAIAQRFYTEWGQAFALSESLDWTSPYVAPEYRLGT